jgi:hypothetical protein
MRKLFTSAFTISAMIFAPCLHADDITTDETAEVTENPQGTPVGQASEAGAKASSNRAWQRIGVAAGFTAVAIVALVLVSTNSGHKK